MIRIKVKAIAIDVNGLEHDVEMEFPVVSQWGNSDKSFTAIVDTSCLDEYARVDFKPKPGFQASK